MENQVNAQVVQVLIRAKGESMNELIPHYMPLSKRNLEEIQYALAQVYGTNNATYRFIEGNIKDAVARGRWG